MTFPKEGEKSKSLAWLVAIVIFLAPISTDIGGGTSINYLFAILLIVAPWGYRYSLEGTAYCTCLLISYLVGLFLFSMGDETFLVRQFVSLVVALLPAMLMFVRLRLSLDQVGGATIFAATAYCAWVLYFILAKEYSLTDVYFIKGNLREFVSDWPQRYVIVLFFGFFLSCDRVRLQYQYVVISLVVLVVVFLTFTRSAYLALLAGGVGYWICARYHVPLPQLIIKRRRFYGFFVKARVVIFISIVVLMLSNENVQNAMNVIFDSTVVNIVGAVTGTLTTESESTLTRLEIWKDLVKFVLESNPLLGTGLAGGYLIFSNDFYGSAHSQYIDVFLRTGIIGSAIYLLLWSRLLVGAFRASPGVFGGVLAMLVFGFFNETTKLSYGAFLFFIYLNLVTETRSSHSLGKAKVAL